MPNDARPDKPRRRPRGLRALRDGVRARTVAACSILVLWGVSMVVDIVSSSYSPPDGFNTVALAAATYLFGSAFLKENK